MADYILKSKLKIVETKVLHTDLSLKGIAWQINFTNSSHLARSFKKVYGITVKEFKNSGQACVVKSITNLFLPFPDLNLPLPEISYFVNLHCKKQLLKKTKQ